MSYSFSVRGATKDAAIAKVVQELDRVVASQPVHAADRRQAEASAESFLSILPDNADGMEFIVSVSGSVGWSGANEEDRVFTSAGVNVSASLVRTEAPVT